MKREKHTDDRPSEDEKQPEDCFADYQRHESKEGQTDKWDSVKKECKKPPLSEQRTRLQHSISQNLGGDRMLHYELMSNFLVKRNNWLQQKIVELLPLVTLEALYDFHEFSRFVKTFLVRTQYQCNSMLYHFLSVAVKRRGPEIDAVSYADLLVETLFKEIQSMNDAVAISATIQDANREYERWLADKVLEEESHEFTN